MHTRLTCLPLAMIPVELESFTQPANENSVTLNWSTATETNNSGFSVERKTPLDERWIEVGFVPGFGTYNRKEKLHIYRCKSFYGFIQL